MMTDTLVATIVADHAAQRDADPQAVIARLKQDLRAARQAATKARNYAERVRDGRAIPEEIAELQEVIARRDESIRSGRAAFARATRRAVNAETERDAAWREIEALRASKCDVAENEPDNLVYLLGRYPELRRAYQLIESLYAAPDGQYAAVANRMLSMIASICAAVEPKAGKGRAA